jgi:hypothetical protein
MNKPYELLLDDNELALLNAMFTHLINNQKMFVFSPSGIKAMEMIEDLYLKTRHARG